MFSSFQKYTSVFFENLSTRLSEKKGKDSLQKKKKADLGMERLGKL